MKIKIGDSLGDVKITGLYKDGNDDQYVSFIKDTEKGTEHVINFKKRLHEPLDEIDI